MLEKDFKLLFINVKNDILNTQYRVMANANSELINLYFRLGKVISDNVQYGNKFVKQLETSLKLEFPSAKGFSARNLSRMKTFYEEYKDFSILPPTVAKLPWTHNYVLLEKVKERKIRLWYAEACIKNGWSKIVLTHKIDTCLYQRQMENPKLTNFNERLNSTQGKLAKEILKDPYIFELSGLKDKADERDIEEAMLERIKTVLLELGKGFSFIANQYKISTGDTDYYIDLLFYHLELRCYVVVELKNTKFKPEYAGQIGFYVTAINETLKKPCDNDTIGLLLCKERDKLSVDWSLKSFNVPLGISSYEIDKYISREILEKLPTEDDINLHLGVEDNL